MNTKFHSSLIDHLFRNISDRRKLQARAAEELLQETSETGFNQNKATSPALLLLTETVASGGRRETIYAVRKILFLLKASRHKRAVGRTMTVHTQMMSHLKLNQSGLVCPRSS